MREALQLKCVHSDALVREPINILHAKGHTVLQGKAYFSQVTPSSLCGCLVNYCDEVITKVIAYQLNPILSLPLDRVKIPVANDSAQTWGLKGMTRLSFLL